MNRQVLAEPSADLAAHTWAALADGTPLVTQATRGAGRIVLFHVTANADWSNLSLSGLFVDMLRRLVALSAGVATTADNAFLAPAETLDGYGLLSHAAAGRHGSAGQRDRPHRRLAAPSAGAVRSGERQAGAQPGRQPADAGGRPGGPGCPGGGSRHDDPGTGTGTLAARRCDRAAGARSAHRARPARAAAAEPGRGRAAACPACCAGRTGIGEQSQPGTGDAARLYRDRRCAVGQYCAGRPGGSVGIRQPAHGGSTRGTRRGRARHDRPQFLSVALLAGQRRCAAAQPGPDRGLERLYEPRRHHSAGYPRFRLGRRLRPGHRVRRCGGSPRGWSSRRWRR